MMRKIMSECSSKPHWESITLWLGRRADWILENLVDVTPAPGFSGLIGANHRMASPMEMACRVLVLRLVATADMATRQADAQMDPAISGSQTFFAAIGIALALGHFVEVRAVIGHKNSRLKNPKMLTQA
jgi:hypothetical protein